MFSPKNSGETGTRKPRFQFKKGEVESFLKKKEKRSHQS